ncbi:organosulfur compounds A [Pseudomonas aeruginosa]|nr:organosulfur compounds A [Pseudomonas aeruginosa]
MSATLRSLDGQDEATILREIQSALRGLRFGAVEITVHNGQVVQIERKEKIPSAATGRQAGLKHTTRLDHRRRLAMNIRSIPHPHRYCSCRPRMRA